MPDSLKFSLRKSSVTQRIRPTRHDLQVDTTSKHVVNHFYFRNWTLVLVAQSAGPTFVWYDGAHRPRETQDVLLAFADPCGALIALANGTVCDESYRTVR